jgi:hypothetical protein
LLTPRSYSFPDDCASRGCRKIGCKPFRDALSTQLRSLTRMTPSLVQKTNERGEKQWVVEPLLR